MKHQLQSQRLGALFAAGWLLLNFPLLGLWDSDATVGGIPVFPLALFGIWAGLIATVAWWMESTPNREPEAAAGDGPEDLQASIRGAPITGLEAPPPPIPNAWPAPPSLSPRSAKPD